jgi:4-amino-4-deoxy-L-arabinose transferase-like glycosyltransferase
LSNILPPTTAGISPEKFSDDLVFARDGRVIAVLLAVFLAFGFALRVHDLGVESFGEDELNKLQTVEEYRASGLSGKNGEHPFLMKGLQTVSLTAADAISPNISKEAALRFPLALFGTFTTLLIFFLFREFFGRSIGLVAAALWAVEPIAIGFDRIAKEDSLAVFFFLLTSFFWARSQSLAERGLGNWPRYVFAAGAGFAGFMASKYYPHMLAVLAGYYNTFEKVPGKKWNLGAQKWLIFFGVMGVTFLILSPTILLPETWSEMLKFSSEKRIGHDAYEYMGELYRNQMTQWVAGVPWTFYYVFILVKSSLSTLVLFLIGVPLLFKRRLGDGRFFLFFWAFLWFLPFTVLGGKFTRYFTIVEPLVLLSAAVAFCFSVKWLTSKLSERTAAIVQVICFAVIIALPLINSFSATPHFRLFTNYLGGGASASGSYFPHDEFYDTASREIAGSIANRAEQGAVVASETPALLEYYARQAGRPDLVFISLSDKGHVAALKKGDVIAVVNGRRYFSNTAYQEFLESSATPLAEVNVAGVNAARIYQLDAAALAGVHEIANKD